MPRTVHVKRNFLYAFCAGFLCLCLILQPVAKAGTEPLQGKEISISVRKSSLANILNQVSKKSGITIYFVDTDIAGYTNIDYDAKDKDVTSILAELFKGKELIYEVISEKQIGVRKSGKREGPSFAERDTLVTVSGTITNEKGEPLPGATVKVKSKNVGATADLNGNFVIKNIPSTSVLTISNVSYYSTEIPISGKSSIGRISLKELISIIDEAVVIAYGETTKRIATGSITSIKSDVIKNQPVNNVLFALQGHVPGLQITPTTGLAGGAINLQIRGKNTLSPSRESQPLIVVDGLPIINNVPGLGFSGFLTNSGDLLSALSFLNPSDIESIEILKDADATSIYGSRGSNGVILITTKKAKLGDTRVDIRMQSGWAEVSKKLALLNTNEYLRLRKEAYSNIGVDLTTVAPNIANADVTLWDQNRYTDWQKELIGGRAQYTDVNASISGGSPTVQYLVGGTFHKETTVFPNTTSDIKSTIHLSLTGASANQRLRSTIMASYTNDHNTLPGSDFTNKAVTLSPNAPVLYKEDGTLNYEPLPNDNRSWDNPLYETYKSYNATISNLISSADISYNLLKNLTIKTQLGFNRLSGKALRKLTPFLGRPQESADIPANVNFATNEVNNLSVEPQLKYSSVLGGGKLEVLFGASYQESSTSTNNTLAMGITSDALSDNLQSATSFNVSNTSSDYKYNAVFGRINYNWKNKYILNINARRDGSSRFGPDNQFGNFGSVGAAWVFTEEDFAKVVAGVLNFGKLRASYGTSGNDGIGDYQYLERYEPIIDVDNYQGAKGFRTLGVFNSYYAWEVTKKLEVGLELSFFKDRLFVSASYFRNRSNNQLLGYSLPSTAGPGSLTYNLPALIQNKGIEIASIIKLVKQRNVNWELGFNISRNTNKLISYPDLETSQDYRDFEIGKPFAGVYKVYKGAGVDPQTGIYQFESVDGKIVSNPEDNSRLDGGRFLRINTNPSFYGGFSNSITVKGISLNFLLQFTKQMGLNPLESFLSSFGRINNVPIEYLSHWRKVGDESDFGKAYPGSAPGDYTMARNRYRTSDFAYVDASFIRLKNISISYDLTGVLKSKGTIKDLRLFLLGQNIFTITGYRGFDPETQSVSRLPQLRVYTFGITIAL